MKTQSFFKKISLFLILLFVFSSHSFSQDTFHCCPMKGDAKRAREQDFNLKKNRYDFPDKSDFDKTVTLEDLLKPGYDVNRFTEGKAIDIEGYVYDVKEGSSETCNCHATDPQYTDTHIEIVVDNKHTGKSQRLIVEVTPRIRKLIKDNKNLDWSTESLYGLIHKKVKVQGWLFFDGEHMSNARNTKTKKSKNIWRATCWEVHPVTFIGITN